MRYHFHIRDSGGLILDDEGSELPDITAARREARASACDLVTEDLRSRLCVQDRQIEIADTFGKVLETMPVRSVLNKKTTVIFAHESDKKLRRFGATIPSCGRAS